MNGKRERSGERSGDRSTGIAQVIQLDDGIGYHALALTDDMVDRLSPEHRRVILQIGPNEYRRALQNRKDGPLMIVVSREIMKENDLRVGEEVEISLRSDPEPDHVEIGEEFAEILAQDDEARARWESFTIGRQRSLALYITQAKRPETRLKRGLELAEKIRTYQLNSDLNR